MSSRHRPRRALSGARGPRHALAATLVVAAGLAALPAPRAAAHDFWIEPDRLSVAAGALTPVSLLVGDPFHGEPVARNPRLIERFVAVGPDGETPVLGAPGQDPAGAFRPAAAGSYWLLYRSRPSLATLAAEKFESYLAAEGLEHVLAARRSRGAQAEPGRELFSRSAKALVWVDPGAGGAPPGPRTPGPSATDPTLPTGLDLDLVPETDPHRLRDGGELPIRLLYRGEPLAGVLLEAHGPQGLHLAARTDGSGRVAFDLAAPGEWLIVGVHMVEAAAGSGADWESLWASLRFAVPGS